MEALPPGPKLSSRLGDMALKRLRDLVRDNGIAPEDLKLNTIEADDYRLGGTIALSPRLIAKRRRYAGAAKSGGQRSFNNFSELLTAINNDAPPDGWFDEAVTELRQTAGEGWGFSGDIEIDSSAQIWSATEPCGTCAGAAQSLCPRCQGRRQEHCKQCNGDGLEQCRYCHGSGYDPTQPPQSKLCPQCQGRRQMQCALCTGRGLLACTQCQAKGTIACVTCKATGKFTEEAEVKVAVAGEFSFQKIDDLPQNIRKIIDRTSFAALARHAEVQLTVPENPREHTLSYEAILPYGDAEFSLDNKIYKAKIVGQKAAILDLPAILDAPLQAAFAKGAPYPRLLIESMTLILQDVGKAPLMLRRLYPAAVSAEMQQKALQQAKLLLRQNTQKAILLAALAMLFISAATGYMWFEWLRIFVPAPQTAPELLRGALDFALLLALCFATGQMLDKIGLSMLRRRLPQLKIPTQAHLPIKLWLWLLWGAQAACYLGNAAFSSLPPLWWQKIMSLLQV